jgi:hypothetical protein
VPPNSSVCAGVAGLDKGGYRRRAKCARLLLVSQSHGNTLTALISQKQIKARLLDIDAPNFYSLQRN